MRDRRRRLPAPAHLRQVTARMSDVTFSMATPSRCVIAKELYWGEGRRPGAADQAALDIFGALARPAELVLDIGAYTGIFSLLAAKVSASSQVHAFEMIPAVAQMATQNVVQNDLLERVTVHLRGIGEDGSSLRVPVGEGGSALPDFYSIKFAFDNGVAVPVRSLDSLLAEIAPERAQGTAPVTLVKIDVEGAEDVVLAGAGQFLTRTRADILCEILPDANVLAVKNLLAPHSYRYFVITDTGLSEEAELYAHPRYRDWLFTTRTDADLDALDVVR